MVAHSARDGGARPPQLARGPSRGADGAPDDVRLWPLPRASQTDEEAGADEPRNQLKQKGKKLLQGYIPTVAEGPEQVE